MSVSAPSDDDLREPVTSLAALRELIAAPEPDAPAVRKEIATLDEHCRRFIALAPLLFISSVNDAGRCDVSPRGDAPGFARVLDATRLVIPERPGNHRADTLRNILEHPRVGLLFLIPGLRETLRVNGVARLYTDAALLDSMRMEGKRPQLAIVVEAEEVFMHCGRALVRSRLWRAETWPARDALPDAARIFADHIAAPDITREIAEEALETSYTTDLY
ncbi:MAG TPA: MSMEG_1061 family FMN-dependent PPOX-type flavoprotein [Ktedonobacterales bacterium]